MPVTGALVPVPTVAALQAAVAADVATSLITIDVGTAGVRVLLIKSVRAEREASAFGVTGHEQQEINCSSCESVGVNTQIAIRTSVCDINHRIGNGQVRGHTEIVKVNRRLLGFGRKQSWRTPKLKALAEFAVACRKHLRWDGSTDRHTFQSSK
jgi:hypothetical protein